MNDEIDARGSAQNRGRQLASEIRDVRVGDDEDAGAAAAVWHRCRSVSCRRRHPTDPAAENAKGSPGVAMSPDETRRAADLVRAVKPADDDHISSTDPE